eukprot:1159584-Pelagomonas_calceolata.AAC.12
MPEQPQQQEPSNNGGAAAAAAAAASGGLTPQGAFAEAQAAYLEPNMAELSTGHTSQFQIRWSWQMQP